MSKKILYHGSAEIVKTPLFGKGKPYNDYGQGFYCTEHEELAKEWASATDEDGFINQYEIDTTALNVLDLGEEKYSILHWLALLMKYRRVRISTPVMKRGVDWLLHNYLIDISAYDVIVGYRADDSYFSFARAFMNNEISLTQLSHAMKLGKLGEQVVLISKKAFEQIKFLSYETVDNTIYYPKRKIRDEEARNEFYRILEEDDIEGIYIRDLMKGVATDETGI